MLDKWEEIKAIITWAKAQNIHALEIGDFRVQFHREAAAKPIQPPRLKTAKELKLEQEKAEREYEETLTWSA